MPHILHKRDTYLPITIHIRVCMYVGGVRVRIDFSRRRFFGLQILDFPGFGLRYLTVMLLSSGFGFVDIFISPFSCRLIKKTIHSHLAVHLFDASCCFKERIS